MTAGEPAWMECPRCGDRLDETDAPDEAYCPACDLPVCWDPLRRRWTAT